MLATPVTRVQAQIVANGSGTVTLNSPNSQNGASASIWGYYTNTSGGWEEATYGTGTVSNGVATINYTIPQDYASNFGWNANAYYSGSTGTIADYEDDNGMWGQFITSSPNGELLNLRAYQFDQVNVGLNGASFRPANNGTVFPNQNLVGSGANNAPYISLNVPWTGTLQQFMGNGTLPPTGDYYTNSKTAISPSYLTAHGYTVDVLQSQLSNQAALNQFQEINIHNASNSYSVNLFAFKVSSSTDPAGYLFDATLINAASSSAVTYDGLTGEFSTTFAPSLVAGQTYFPTMGFEEYDSPTSSTNSWNYGPSGTAYILSGQTVPEPSTIVLLGVGAISMLAYAWRRRAKAA